MTLSDDERAIVFLDSMDDVEYRHKANILSLYSSPKEIFADKRPIRAYLEKHFPGGKDCPAAKALCDDGSAAAAVRKAVSGADGVVALGSPDYPESLAAIQAPPLILYYRGRKELLGFKDKFAIVGSRKTLRQYCALAENIAERLSENGVAVVTGIAEGADKAASEGALRGGGNLISVFAGGTDCVYPAMHKNLAERIAADGLILSERPCGRYPKYYSFPVRNRIIAGLSGGVLIASGAETSGARHTAGYALDYGREVLCFPYGLGHEGALCKVLLRDGATMCESAEDVAEAMRYDLKADAAQSLNEDEKAVYKLIKSGVSDQDEIAVKLKKPVYEVMTAISMLEIKRLVVREADSSLGAI